MAIFLDAQQIYRLLQRELPEGVYPDGAPTAFFSAASVYSKSVLFEAAYQNMSRIYANIFPQTADEKQTDWEVKVFGYTLDGALSLAVRRQKVIDKLRLRPGITIADMIRIVKSVIGDDKDVSIQEWQNESGSWIIGVSQLGLTTIFGDGNRFRVTPQFFPGQDLCDLTAAQAGLTPAQFKKMQDAAYTYSVIIKGYTLTADELVAVDAALTAGEPARSTHAIYSGVDQDVLLTEDGQVLETEDGQSILVE